MKDFLEVMFMMFMMGVGIAVGSTMVLWALNIAWIYVVFV